MVFFIQKQLEFLRLNSIMVNSNGVQESNRDPVTPNFKPTSPQGKSSSLSTIESGGNLSVSEQSSNNKSQDNSFLECCKCVTLAISYLGIAGMFLVLLGVIGGVISYYVFGIKFLIKDYQTSQDCDSDLGNFVLVSLVVSFLIGYGQSKANKGEDAEVKLCMNIVFCLFWLGWGIWGLIITQDEDCDDLKDTNLLKFSNAISIYFISMGSLIIFMCLAFSIIVACKKKN